MNFEDLPKDIILFIFHFLTFDANYFLINHNLKNLYHLTNTRYCINAKGVRLTFHVENSDHDGYCSDGYCEYSSIERNLIFFFEKKYHSIMALKTASNKIIKDSKKFCNNPASVSIFDDSNPYSTLIPVLNGGSFYCTVSPESKAHGLHQHDYRITLISWELF